MIQLHSVEYMYNIILNKNLSRCRMANPTTDDLSKWYSYRSCVIERLSRQVDLSVELVKLATERGVEVSVKSIESILLMQPPLLEVTISKLL